MGSGWRVHGLGGTGARTEATCSRSFAGKRIRENEGQRKHVLKRGFLFYFVIFLFACILRWGPIVFYAAGQDPGERK